MTLQEICKLLDRSECTLMTHFSRTQSNLAKKGIKLIKEGEGKNAQYYLEYKDPLILPIIPNGTKVGRLTIIDNEKKDGKQYYKCECECGNIKMVAREHLKDGSTKSCGCLKKELTSERSKTNIPIGSKFGHLTVLKELNKRDNQGLIMYLCQCECGNTKEVASYYLVKNITTSCGCKNESKGEQKIKEILLSNNFFFEQQKTFDNCKFLDTNYPAYFDFYVNNKYIIEYDGSQHFKYKGSGWNTEEHLIKTQEHDNYKNQYCFEHNIPIIRIPYTHLNDICLEDLIPETSQFLLKQEE